MQQKAGVVRHCVWGCEDDPVRERRLDAAQTTSCRQPAEISVANLPNSTCPSVRREKHWCAVWVFWPFWEVRNHDQCYP